MKTTDYIHALTRLDARKQNQLAQYYAGLPGIIRERAHERQRQLVTSWANNHRAGVLDARFAFESSRPGANGYAALLVALSEIRTAEQAILKGRNVDVETLALCDQVRQARANDTDKRPKANPKKKLILAHLELISDLRSQRQSWRRIEQHEVFKGKVTYVLLQQTYTEEMKNRELAKVALASGLAQGPKAVGTDPQMRFVL